MEKIAGAEEAGGIGSQAPGAEGGGPGIGAYVGAAGTALSLGKMAFGKPDVDTSGMTAPEEVPSKGSAALSGAMAGASAGMAFGPWGAAIGGVVGGAAGLMGNKKAEKAQDKAHLNYTSRIHDQSTGLYELGGTLDSHDASPVNGASELVTMFEGGGTHEQNSLGGIPQGMGSNGKPNLVEEGETKFEDYIFSNNINMDGTYSDKEGTKDGQYKKGGMLKRADGSYSKRGLWDNIRANKGSGKKPTKEMLAQERKINKKEEGGPLDPPTKASSLKALRAYQRENNPERMDSETDSQYKARQDMFAAKIEEGKSSLDKAWESVKEYQEGMFDFLPKKLAWLPQALSEVITSPVDLAYGIKKKIDIPNTEKYKTKQQLRNDNWKIGDAVLDNAGLLTAAGLVANLPKKTAFNLSKKAAVPLAVSSSQFATRELAGEAAIKGAELGTEELMQQYAYGGTLSDLTRMVPSKGPSIQELLRIKKRKELAAKRKKRKNK